MGIYKCMVTLNSGDVKTKIIFGCSNSEEASVEAECFFCGEGIKTIDVIRLK